ncbi:hypothetical protein vseg_013475 [Gypsophila vaccaria]
MIWKRKTEQYLADSGIPNTIIRMPDLLEVKRHHGQHGHQTALTNFVSVASLWSKMTLKVGYHQLYVYD